MKKYFLLLTTIGLGGIFIMTACASAPASPTLPVDVISTLAFQQVYIMMTQTALAVSPTPSITLTPAETPTPTETLVFEATQPPKRPVVTAFADCRAGPGPQYTHITNISPKKYVNLIGVGSVPGWYVIRDPYFRNICWIEASYLKFDPRMDTSKYPVMTPANP
jgi:hypothetical protein